MLNILLLIKELFYYLKKIFLSKLVRKRTIISKHDVKKKEEQHKTANHAAALMQGALEKLDCLRKGGPSECLVARDSIIA